MNQHEREKIYALQSDILGRLSKDKELLARVSFYPASSVPIVHSIFADEKIAEVIHYRMLEVLSHIFHIEGGKWHACKTCEFGGSKDNYHRRCSDWDVCPVLLIMIRKLGLSIIR